MFFFFCLLATTFGSQLYFSENGNINNPLVNPIYWQAKDLILTSMMFYWCIYGFKNKVRYNYQMVVPLIILVLLLILNPLIKFGRLDLSYLKIVKNFALYGLLLSLSYPEIKRRYGLDKILKTISAAVFVSLIVGFCFYFADYVPSSDKRMYGTYGNPTSMGFVALAGVACSYMILRKLNKLFFLIYLIVSAIAINYAGSFSAFLAFILFFPTVYLMKFGHHKLFGSKKTTKLDLGLALGVPVLFFITALSMENLRSSELVSRIICVSGFGATCKGEILQRSNSLSDRVLTFEKVARMTDVSLIFFGSNNKEYFRTDSSLIAFFVNYGLTSSLLLIYIFIRNIFSSLFKEAKKNMEYIMDKLIISSSFILILLFLNLPLQHQIELFPSNIIFFLVLLISDSFKEMYPS